MAVLLQVVGMAAMQDELGEQAVTVLVTFDPDDQGGHVHFEVSRGLEEQIYAPYNFAQSGPLMQGRWVGLLPAQSSCSSRCSAHD